LRFRPLSGRCSSSGEDCYNRAIPGAKAEELTSIMLISKIFQKPTVEDGSGVNTPDTSISVAIVEVNYLMSSLVNPIVLLNKLLFNNRMIPCTR
jgi:hypothetical protein